MGFHSLINRIPFEISGLGAPQSAIYTPTDNIYDYALAGIPFVSATRDQFPYTEQMAAIRKQQFDSFAEPGEQSLYGWWLRSQSNFTGGAGLLYQDPDNDNQFNLRFADSLGIDCWTPGQVKLLRGTTQAHTGVPAGLLKVKGYVDTGNVPSYYEARSNAVFTINNTTLTNTAYDSAQTVYDIDATGTKAIIADATGIYVYDHANLGSNHRAYNSVKTQWTIGFKKGRLIACTGPAVYQLDINQTGASLPATPIYQTQDANWTWKSVTDGPTAIYIAGDSGTTSEIHKFTATVDSSGVPQLAWAGVTASMPTGETITEIYQYVETFVGIATNKGFRVGTIDGNGDISYGPLLFQPVGGCQGIIGYDRFMWVGSSNAHDGASGLYRVDLGTAIQEQTTNAVRYAYARDIYTTGFTGTISSLTMFGNTDQKIIAANGLGIYKENATTLLPSGYLKTGRVRYNTEEPKLYKFLSARTPTTLLGAITISVLPEAGGEFPVVTYGAGAVSSSKDIAITDPVGPQNWLALKFTLNRSSTDTTQGGILNGWQLKALPGSIRQRLITTVFAVFDEISDKKGQRFGYDGYARDTLDAFKAAVRTGDTLVFQELAANVSTQVFIEDWQFRMSSPPSDGPNKGSIGGFLQVTMRTVAEAT